MPALTSEYHADAVFVTLVKWNVVQFVVSHAAATRCAGESPATGEHNALFESTAKRRHEDPTELLTEHAVEEEVDGTVHIDEQIANL